MPKVVIELEFDREPIVLSDVLEYIQECADDNSLDFRVVKDDPWMFDYYKNKGVVT